MPDFQSVKNRIPERLNPPLLFALLLAFELALFSESVGECHGFIFERLGANSLDAFLERGRMQIRIQNISQQLFECTLGYRKQARLDAAQKRV